MLRIPVRQNKNTSPSPGVGKRLHSALPLVDVAAALHQLVPNFGPFLALVLGVPRKGTRSDALGLG